MEISEMLKKRHEVHLEWVVPWQSCGPEGNDLDACVYHRATVHDCINMARYSARENGRPTIGDDEEFLLDFIVVNWAEPIL